MLSYQNIKTVALYEKKTLMRSWFFKIFTILAILGITIFHLLTTIETGMSTWVFKAIPGNIPYSNLKYLNIIQSIIAVFLASGFLKRDKKFDTSEVIYVRPMSNAEYILGKTLGIFKVFMGLNIISLLIAFIINAIGSNTPLDIVTYFIYPLIISIPSIIFILGLSFLLMVIIKNQSITFLILLGYIGLCVFYFGSSNNGLLDYTSFHIPLIYSDIVGFGNISKILIHRGAYLFLGFGFICLTIININRLPHSIAKIKRYAAFSIFLIICGASFIFYLAKENNKITNKRIIFRNLDDQYFHKPNIDITDININLTHKEKEIKCEANLIIKNNTQKVLKSFILSLNPGLKITKIDSDNLLKTDRKEHIIIITPENPLNIGEEKKLKIVYGGTIDENICYKDIDDETYNSPFNVFNFNIDKRFAFVSENILLLTPEVLWYPIAGINYNSKKPVFSKYNFTNYYLKVNTNKRLTAISQGRYSKIKAGVFTFKPETPLTQLSLIIGDFEQKSLIVDSLEIKLLHYHGHDYFSAIFNDIKDTIPSLIREFKNQYELDKERNYPFNRLTLVEVPVQFKTFPRLWTTHRETVQPEMVLLPESGITLPEGDFESSFNRMKSWRQMRNGNTDDKTIKINLFNRTLNQIFKTSGGYTSSLSKQMQRSTNFHLGFNISTFNENIYSLDPNFFTYANNVSSIEYPIINTLFESILNNGSTNMRKMYRSFVGGLSKQEISNIYLKENSLEEILADNNLNYTSLPAIIENKANYLKAILTNKINKDKFKNYISNYFENNKFKNVPLNNLIDDYQNKFKVKIEEDIKNWYTSNKIPGYIISRVTGTKIIDKDSKKYQLIFNIRNPEQKAGIVNVSIMSGNMRFGRSRFRSQSPNETNYSYYIEPNSSYKIGIVCPQKPMMMSINTLTSQNIPASLTSRFENFEESNRSPFHGIKKINDIYSSNNEIIVDNEDPGFSLEENIKEVKLKRLFKKKENIDPDNKYKRTTFWKPPLKWTLTAQGDYYGKYIRSAYYIKAGDGKQKAIWKAKINEPGNYDVYFFKQAEKSFFFGRGRRTHKFNMSKMNYDITVCSDDGEDKMEINTTEHTGGWIYLGSYYFSPGYTKVILTNKSEASLVYADAVKWVKNNNK